MGSLPAEPPGCTFLPANPRQRSTAKATLLLRPEWLLLVVACRETRGPGHSLLVQKAAGLRPCSIPDRSKLSWKVSWQFCPETQGCWGLGHIKGCLATFWFMQGISEGPRPRVSGWGAQHPGACPQSLPVPLSRIPLPEVPWELGELDSFSWGKREIEATCFATPRAVRAQVTLRPGAACR